MQPLDWIIISVPLVLVLGIGAYTQQFLKSVADFLTAGRGVGRYLLAISRMEPQGGAVVFVAGFESISRAGFTLVWWTGASALISVIMSTTGFVYYRYRETRAMTLAQFFELRYSKSFRLFAGFVGFFSGVLNFAVIPVVGARTMCYVMQLPATVHLFSLTLPSDILVLAVTLSITTFLTVSGGLITIVLTNGAEGIISLILYVVIICTLAHMFSWHQINEVLVQQPAGQSFVNPFDTSQTKDFGIWFVVMNILLGIYGTMAWQNQSAYNSAATTAHESRMAGIVGRWLGTYKGAMMFLMAMCAMAYLHHPDFTAQANEVQRAVAQIPGAQTQEQELYPVTLSHMLPAGVRGALCVIFVMGLFGGDGAALHSWGSLFIQDILVPLRKKPFGPKHHVFFLRLSIIGVALFAFVFGSFFRQTEYLAMWWAVTGAVFVGGAGAAILGGLYWSRGTAAGAWTGMLTGSITGVTGITVREFYPQFPLNGLQVSFAVSVLSSAVYIGVSLLTCREKFNMDRMLHRGAYAKIAESVGDEIAPPVAQTQSLALRLIGIDENFTRGDRWLAMSVFVWSAITFVIFVVGTVWNLIAPWPTAVWSEYWLIFGIIIPVAITIGVAFWFTWGGLVDMRSFFIHLRERKVNFRDDGTVVNHQNLDESVVPETAVPTPRTPDGKPHQTV